MSVENKKRIRVNLWVLAYFFGAVFTFFIPEFFPGSFLADETYIVLVLLSFFTVVALSLQAYIRYRKCVILPDVPSTLLREQRISIRKKSLQTTMAVLATTLLLFLAYSPESSASLLSALSPLSAVRFSPGVLPGEPILPALVALTAILAFSVVYFALRFYRIWKGSRPSSEDTGEMER